MPIDQQPLPQNSVKAGHKLECLGEIFEGLSLSGIRTSITMPRHEIAFDVATGFPFSLKMKKFFISHGHLDHAAGIPYLLSQKAMHNEASPDIYMPSSLLEPMQNIIRIWEQIEQHTYQINFHPVFENFEVYLNPQKSIRSFRTHHRIESFGYSLFQHQKKLRPQFANLTQQEIINHKKSGLNVEETISQPLVSFTGDTTIDFLESTSWISQSKILICEATYLDERKSISEAKKWGHTHLDEIIAHLDDIQSEKIVLIHISSRYRNNEIQEIIKKKVPNKHQERIVIFPGR